MTEDTVQVEVARTVERDALLAVLKEHGLEARAVDGEEMPGIEIPCGGEAGRGCDEVLAEVEAWIADSGLPLVPVKSNGAVLLRPPSS